MELEGGKRSFTGDGVREDCGRSESTEPPENQRRVSFSVKVSVEVSLAYCEATDIQDSGSGTPGIVLTFFNDES